MVTINKYVEQYVRDKVKEATTIKEKILCEKLNKKHAKVIQRYNQIMKEINKLYKERDEIRTRLENKKVNFSGNYVEGTKNIEYKYVPRVNFDYGVINNVLAKLSLEEDISKLDLILKEALGE